jgi:hypothetical protein
MAEASLSKLEFTGNHSVKVTGIVLLTTKQVAFFLSLGACFVTKLTPLIPPFSSSLRAFEILDDFVAFN